MNRLLFAAVALFPAVAQAQMFPKFVTLNCHKASENKIMADSLNSILERNGEGFLRYAVPIEQDGPTACMVGFQTTDGRPMSGVWRVHYDLANHLVASFQDLTPPY